MFAGEFVQVLRVKADTVVFDAQGKVLLVEHADFDVLGFGVFVDVGQAPNFSPASLRVASAIYVCAIPVGQAVTASIFFLFVF